MQMTKIRAILGPLSTVDTVPKAYEKRTKAKKKNNLFI